MAFNIEGKSYNNNKYIRETKNLKPNSKLNDSLKINKNNIMCSIECDMDYEFTNKFKSVKGDKFNNTYTLYKDATKKNIFEMSFDYQDNWNTQKGRRTIEFLKRIDEEACAGNVIKFKIKHGIRVYAIYKFIKNEINLLLVDQHHLLYIDNTQYKRASKLFNTHKDGLCLQTIVLFDKIVVAQQFILSVFCKYNISIFKMEKLIDGQ